MKLVIFLLVTGLLVTNAFGGSDAFTDVKYGSDIPKALTGKRMSNQKVADLEKRHTDLVLRISVETRFLNTCQPHRG